MPGEIVEDLRKRHRRGLPDRTSCHHLFNGKVVQASTTTGTPSPLHPGGAPVQGELQRGRSAEVREPGGEPSRNGHPQEHEQVALRERGDLPEGGLYPGGHLLQGHGVATPPPAPGWNEQGSYGGMGHEQQMMMIQMFNMLRQENQALRAEQGELMQEIKHQRASFEARVHQLQRDLDSRPSERWRVESRLNVNLIWPQGSQTRRWSVGT